MRILKRVSISWMIIRESKHHRNERSNRIQTKNSKTGARVTGIRVSKKSVNKLDNPDQSSKKESKHQNNNKLLRQRPIREIKSAQHKKTSHTYNQILLVLHKPSIIIIIFCNIILNLLSENLMTWSCLSQS